jgi:diguanylate cyclase (GGDEF)-like protein
MSKSELFLRWMADDAMVVPSGIAREVMLLCEDKASSLGEIVSAMEADPNLCSYLLEYANYISTPADQIISLHNAAAKLGPTTIMNMALGFSLLAENKTGPCILFDHQGFWAQSLARALAARSLALRTGNNNPEELFICGMLARVGSLTLAALFPQEYTRLLSEQLDRKSLLDLEDEQFGMNSEELSSRLLQAWGLPERCAEALKFYGNAEQPDLVDESITLISSILLFAGTIAEICMLEMPLQDRIVAAEESAVAFGLEEHDFEEIFNDIITSWQRWGYVLKIPVQDCPRFQRLKDTDFTAPVNGAHPFNKEPFRILVTDDDPMTLLSLSRLLKSSGKQVFTAENGADGLALALEKRPHMLITDWRMPKLNGIDFCKALRENDITRHIYIIMLTGKESDDELVQALEAGADDFMVKPFTPKVMEARIRSGERIIGFQQKIHRDREIIQQYADLLASANLKLQNMAMTDVLTGLPNRRSALNRLKEVVAEAKRHNEPLCCIMIDIDHFKRVNDKYGHDIGDKVLKEIAAIFNSSARSYDMVSRIGGEEFLVICARSSLDDTGQLAERLRAAVELHRVIYEHTPIQTTISLGVAAWSEEMADGEEMTRAADLALYQAKQQGRNRVVTKRENVPL